MGDGKITLGSPSSEDEFPMICEDDTPMTWCYSLIDSDCTPLLADIDATRSDITFAERDGSPPPHLGKWEANLDEDTVDYAKENEPDSPDSTLVNADESFGIVDVLHRPRRRRNLSVDPIYGVTRRPSVPLRARSKTNGGLLEFKADCMRPKSPEAVRRHRRNMSLKLPIRTISSQPENNQLARAPPSARSVLTPTPSSDDANILTQVERDLQYSHRHIFVGTSSLHSFLEVLETPSVGTISRLAVMKAFTTLASNEQLLARQRSSSVTDWSLVTRITSDISTFDYVTLARVQLGSVSLHQFVDLIPFNIRDEAPITVVVEAFKTASHMDAEAGLNVRSKAREFRKWLLAQKDALE